MQIGKRAEALIINFEGWDVPWLWPGDSSGITLPVGYDIGYEPFARDWADLLDPKDFARLNATAGLKGKRAQAVAPTLRGIHIPKTAALHVFENVTVPRYESQTKAIFIGSDRGPADAFGALVSLVFNRGNDLHDVKGRKPRTEMRSIAQVFQTRDPQEKATWMRVADLVEAQARYWRDNKRSDGDLHDRREDEAELIRSSF